MTAPLQLAFPELARVRTLTAWSELAYVVPEIDLERAGAGLEAWSLLDEEFGDPAGAAAHRHLADLLAQVGRVGIAEAFATNARARREQCPAQLTPSLAQIDEGIAGLLAGDDLGGVRAVDTWMELAASGALEGVPDPLRISLLCDGVALHEIAYAVSGDPTQVDRRRDLLTHTLSAFRTFDRHVSMCRVHLDPRLSRVSGALGVASSDSRLLSNTVALIHPCAPDQAVWMFEAVALLERSAGQDGMADEMVAAVVAAEPQGSHLGTRASRWRLAVGMRAFLAEGDDARLEPVAPGTGDIADRLLDLVEGELGLPPADDLVDLVLRSLMRLGVEPGAADRAARLSALLAEHSPELDDRRRLEVRIALMTVASSVTSPSDSAKHANDLAALHLTRFDRYGDLIDVQRAIDVLQQVELDTLLPDEAAGTLGNLAVALSTRAQFSKAVADLDLAATAAERAVALTGSGAALAVRASVAYGRYQSTQDAGSLDRAISDWRQADAAGPPDDRALVRYNLGNALLVRDTAAPGDLDEPLRMLSSAVIGLERPTADSALAANRLAEAVHRRARRAAGAIDPRELARATRWSDHALRWARASSDEMLLRVAWDAGVRAELDREWIRAASYYAVVVDAVGNLVDSNSSTVGIDAWLTEGFGAPTRAAASWIRSGQPERAVLVLERGRGLLLRAAVGLIPGVEESPAITDVTASLGQPLLYLVPGPAGGFALLLDPQTPDTVGVVELARLSEEELGRTVAAFHQAAAHATTNVRAWRLTLQRTIDWLGQALAPVVSNLHGSPLSVVATGALSFLPVHVALGNGLVSMAPTAATLAVARAGVQQEEVRGPVLAVCNPTPSSLRPLQFAAAEAGVVAAFADGAVVLTGPAASVEQVTTQMPAFAVVHLACHAAADVADPRSSHLVLANDQPLHLATVAGLDLDTLRLVVLSACETGVPGAAAPDETLTLGTAFFAAGAEGVVSSLWQVADLATLVLVASLYGYLADGLTPAAALARAQAVLRDLTRAQLEAHVAALHEGGRLPAETLDIVLDELSRRGDASSRPLSSPDYWAAFVFTGC